MTSATAAAQRRTARMKRPARLAKATRSFQNAVAGLVITSALAPFAALAQKKTRPRKAAAPKAGRSLGNVVRQLRAVQTLRPGGRPAAAHGVSPHIPTGAQYLTRTHRSAWGSRSYRLYLPASHPRRPRGLILMLHGCDQSPDDFAVGTHMAALAERHGLALAFPAQPARRNSGGCWNWFRPGDQARGAGEPALLAALMRKLAREYGFGRDESSVAGLSAGGAMAAILADVYPDVFSAAGLHSGLARGAARDVFSAMAAMRSGGRPSGASVALVPASKPVRRIIFHGDTDSTVHPSNAAMIVAAALGDDAVPTRITKRSVRGRGYARSDFAAPDGVVALELWMLDGAGHAWSGGRAAGSYTDRAGPDASAEMIRFFLAKST